MSTAAPCTPRTPRTPRTPAKRTAPHVAIFSADSPATDASPILASRKRARLRAPPRDTVAGSGLTVALGGYTLVSTVARDFGLSFSDIGDKHILEPADLQPSAYTVPPHLPQLMRAVAGHCAYFHRGSEAICRTLVDLVLMESLFILNGATNTIPEHPAGAPTSHSDGHSHSHSPDDATKATPTPAHTAACALAPALVVNGGVAIAWTDPVRGTHYTGCADYSVGIPAVASSATPSTAATPSTPGKPVTPRPAAAAQYAALLLLAEAKHANNVDAAEGQLAAYLAVLHAHRTAAKRAHANPRLATPTRVYGFATDGLRYTFMAIDAGTIRCSYRMQLRREEDARAIVGAVVGILERELRLREELVRRSRPNSRVSSGSFVPSQQQADRQHEVVASAVAVAHNDGPLEDAALMTLELLEMEGMIDDAPVVDTLSTPYAGAITNPEEEEEEEAE